MKFNVSSFLAKAVVDNSEGIVSCLITFHEKLRAVMLSFEDSRNHRHDLVLHKVGEADRLVALDEVAIGGLEGWNGSRFSLSTDDVFNDIVET